MFCASAIAVDIQGCLHAVTRAWHDGAFREVAGEKVVVHGDVFVADGILLEFAVHDAIHQEEREPAWRHHCQSLVLPLCILTNHGSD